MLENYQKTILKIISTRFRTNNEPTVRCWLLPDGKFLTMDDDRNGFKQPHYTVDNFIGNFVFDYLGKSWEEWRRDSEEDKKKKEQEYNITEEEIQEIYDNVDWDKVGGEYGSPTLEAMGCVRLNAEQEHIVIIPARDKVNNLTNEQYWALNDWLKEFLDGSDKHEFFIESGESEEELVPEGAEFDYTTDKEEIIKGIKRYYQTGKLEIESSDYLESLDESMSLDEATRSQLLDKGRKGQNYKDQSKGKNRFDRRTKSRVATTVRQYNDIDFDAFFKRDILNVGIEVYGETSNYIVKLKFGGVLNEIARNIKDNDGVLEFKNIISAIMRVFNSGDVYVHCSCPDSRYRMNFWQTKNGYSALPIETRPSNITNPDDLLGSACKHTLLVLSNLNWVMKVATTIKNYIRYSQQHLQRNYAEYIFPKLYGMRYKDAVQDSMFENGLLPSDQETIRKANEFVRKSTQFKPGNKEGIRFAKNPENQEKEPEQMRMSIEDEIDKLGEE